MRGEGEASSSAAVLDIQEGEGSERERGRRERDRGRERDEEEGGEVLLSSSEDIFIIPPQLSIDEKLFQDEVILWSHYVKLTDSLQQPQSVSFKI